MRARPYSYERSIQTDNAPRASSFGTIRRVYRYDGINKTRSTWDGLRKDPELWSTEGDCTIHFYSYNSSKRGPSLRIPFRVVEQTNSRYLLQHCLQRFEPTSPAISDNDHSDSGYGGSVSSDQAALQCVELYISAPPHATKHEAHIFHLSTRNYFAYLLDAPLVGESLGKALIGLWSRLQLWQPSDMIASDFRVYCQEQGYLSYSENPDYALATLHFCEQTKSKDMWVDAFSHCAGMYHRLQRSDEIFSLSSTSKALLRAASLKMDQHITQAIKSIGTFLEEELGLGYLGLSKPLRDHLDLYRSTLHSFYVNKVGYWPPKENASMDKGLWRGMYNDFRSLYDYLADTLSSNDRAENRADGGVCVMQNLHNFDERHHYTHLPHPLPLLPEQAPSKRTVDPQRGSRSFKLGRRITFTEPRTVTTPAQALKKATNSHRLEVMNNGLVQDYMRFERSKLEEKTTITEARKVRFMLAYCMLQTLISITRAPPEVRDADTPSYPLCVLSARFPPWMDDTSVFHIPKSPVKDAERNLPVELPDTSKASEEDRISIHPDCEADNANAYFTNMNSITRSGSDMSLSSMAPPLRRSSARGRRESFMNGVSSLHRSMMGSLTRAQRRGSVRSSHCNSIVSPISPTIARSNTLTSYKEIMVEGYGNGLIKSNSTPSFIALAARKSMSQESIQTIIAELPANANANANASSDPNSTPTLPMQQLSIGIGGGGGGPEEALQTLESNNNPTTTSSPLSNFDFNFTTTNPNPTKHPTPSPPEPPPALKRQKPSTYAAKLLLSRKPSGFNNTNPSTSTTTALSYTMMPNKENLEEEEDYGSRGRRQLRQTMMVRKGGGNKKGCLGAGRVGEE
ncbi:uncharacterized protein MYCFIDRAFT_86846 [Pseudocercospora fijiensis CIRAD86]|uniref:DUF8004 domain-containing protein n=1 Tax=Pseudocercospora fijiensis (strain CIRAD86) TaxID=383855 RepID=M3AT59_PSEFD|nr:uncharacterized protein MYCFIDRAFT_86846 [Pseudocercospora fijiensis CIRAD86]EME80308.1 hypothetical protein MYCFIDRAFT_86846 [Pseudocercospora fijiensis CIRAD86]